jgi:hypothetical protein
MFTLKNRVKPTNKICGKNAELITIKVGGIYTYQRALND